MKRSIPTSPNNNVLATRQSKMTGESNTKKKNREGSSSSSSFDGEDGTPGRGDAFGATFGFVPLQIK
jgi:hypothetical protein